MQPMQFKLTQLQYFLDVAKTGSFTKAGDKNFTSQSNISYGIRELEKALEVPLFIRENSELTLTKYAKELLPYVEKAFSELEEGYVKIQQMSNPTSGNVRIGFSFIFSLSTIPDLFRYIFTATNRDNVQIDLHPVMAHVNDNLQCVEDMILDGTCDLGVTCVRVRDEIESIPIDKQELVLLLPPEHPLAHEKKLSLKDVKDEPFILLNGDTEITGNYYIKLFKYEGITPNLVNTSGMDWLSLLVEVSAGRCLTITPRSNLSGYDVAEVELDHPMRMRDVHIAWPTNRKLSPATNYVKKLIIDYFCSKK